MPTPIISRERSLQIIAAVEDALEKGYRPKGTTGRDAGAISIAADSLGINRSTINSTLHSIWNAHQLAPDWTKYRAKRAEVKTEPKPPVDLPKQRPIEVRPVREVDTDEIISVLKRQGLTLDELAELIDVSRGAALDWLDTQRALGLNVHQFGERWCVEKMQAPAFASGDLPTFTSEPDNIFRFGVMADSHLCSKYERLDALNDCYDKFQDEGITRVYHCGNWIEGEARFNRTDLLVHGMDAQLEYLAENYPQRPGITTYAVTGDDHEGWYGQREGVDIGRRAEQTMRENGRADWVNLGFMEAHIKLTNANTGKWSTLAVTHPGGGSSYAISYVVQKIIESLDGGEKPAVWLGGHYHKSGYFVYRNVHCVLVPSTKDQDIFMRKKRISSIVGGGIVTLRQDPETGAIPRCLPDLWQYYNKGYSNDRWSHSGGVILPDRSTI